MPPVTWASLLREVRYRYHVTEVTELARVTVETAGGGHVAVEVNRLAYTPDSLLEIVDRLAEAHDRTLPTDQEQRELRPHNTADLRHAIDEAATDEP